MWIESVCCAWSILGIIWFHCWQQSPAMKTMIILVFQRRMLGLRKVKSFAQGQWQSQDSHLDLSGPKAEALTHSRGQGKSFWPERREVKKGGGPSFLQNTCWSSTLINVTIKCFILLNISLLNSKPSQRWEIGVVQSLSFVWLFVIPWTVACQAPLSMEFSRPEY